MANCEAISDLDFLAILAADSEKGADYTHLILVWSDSVVEDGEDDLDEV